MGENVYWPLRLGFGFDAVNTSEYSGNDIMFKARADLLGLAYKFGHFLFEMNLPSVRYSSEFQYTHTVSVLFALRIIYLF